MLNRRWLLAALSLLLIFPAPRTGWAGVGMGTSNPTLVDTQAPFLQVDSVPDELLQGGDEYIFHWTAGDANPGQAPENFQARILVDGEAISEIDWLENPAEYYWQWTAPEVQSGNLRLEVVVQDIMGNTTQHLSDQFTVLLSTTPAPDLPGQLRLGTPYPNPFNPSCSLEFTLPAAGYATVAVYDVRGRCVRHLWQGNAPAGSTHLEWQGTSQDGQLMPAGVYYFVLETPDQPRQVTRAILIP